MKRTEILQEIRIMRFEEAYGGWQKGRLSQGEAAEILGVCSRTFRTKNLCIDVPAAVSPQVKFPGINAKQPTATVTEDDSMRFFAILA